VLRRGGTVAVAILHAQPAARKNARRPNANPGGATFRVSTRAGERSPLYVFSGGVSTSRTQCHGRQKKTNRGLGVEEATRFSARPKRDQCLCSSNLAWLAVPG